MGTTKMLNAETADFETQSRYRAAASSPVRVLQIGEGNFCEALPIGCCMNAARKDCSTAVSR
ncbi:hypothetical protein PACILC2_25620 [Paenibacillus cisolokensis]|uniref:Uncharacterized protein n=1 Tax=Paenibacillus cisolokensis TaxID=1658519 RepID=A0ABQ4N744_9BACL|nr:hypothetical protein [Paenibacillus cisolokensis]GIQ63994.1 hypothetical protein PACILC2_25620 [Paenibacillus cisolokensis]